MDFKTELKIYQDIVNKELEKYLRKDECIEKVLNNAMEYSLMAGGKRLRPILVLATYKLFKENIEECLPYAVAIEMVHNFSLIHDDLPGIDNDDFRHGKPTNHKQFNEATAILAGDGLLNNAYMVIANDLQHTNNEINMDNINSNHNINSKNCIKNLKNLENKNNPISYVEKLNKKIRIFNEFSNAVDRMIAGEYIDTEYEGKQVLEENLEYMDPMTHEKYVPYCIEPAVGVERVFLSVFADAYDEEVINEKDTRIVMHLHPALAPVKACITPLSKKQNDLAMKLFEQLCVDFSVDFDDAGSIGKRYRRADAIGTPFCITPDFDSENDQSVTLRDRDTMEQVRLPIHELVDYLTKKIRF